MKLIHKFLFFFFIFVLAIIPGGLILSVILLMIYYGGPMLKSIISDACNDEIKLFFKEEFQETYPILDSELDFGKKNQFSDETMEEMK